jgi:hypothetical protein
VAERTYKLLEEMKALDELSDGEAEIEVPLSALGAKPGGP